MTAPNRIRWEPTKYGGWTGHVGTMEPWAFQIWQVDGPDSPWRLDSALLSQFGYHIDHPDPAPLKAHAERWLAGFVSSLGAVFQEPAVDNDCGECGFGLPRHDKDCSQSTISDVVADSIEQQRAAFDNALRHPGMEGYR